MNKVSAVLALTALVAGLLISAAEARAAERGPVTNLPMPRFVSLKADKANVRRGPSLTHKIDWVYTRRGMPLTVTGEFGHWRRVQDRDGVGGWVHYSLLSGARTGIVDRDLTPVRARAVPDAQVKARLEVGVIVHLDECGPVWCRVKVAGHRGWAEKAAFWGVTPGEVFD
ncbi:MAG: SH3 domain-containing protein [Maritimibacter harenae]|jgi:SH3-like domain-containing protein|uniref:Aspartyl-trna synthetase n=1 Tax=Maritimibacter harenae TaxID=2606218 RepID=A0A845M2Q4_9RHOB|nr:SH3 domain-containing protein [Maritimibacter harenae]MZR14620.1 aspartyl-trna synthetase [Maritimibacter harenae]